jgi:hypothetical protein
MRIIVLFTTLILFFSSPTFADLRINELYPAPSSGNTEWVELFNTEVDEESTETYTLIDKAGNNISLPLIVPGLGFAIATASSVLNNSGDTVYLKNLSGNIVDVATYSATLLSTESYARCIDGIGF